MFVIIKKGEIVDPWVPLSEVLMIISISNLFLTFFVKQFQITHASSFKQHEHQGTYKRQIEDLKTIIRSRHQDP